VLRWEEVFSPSHWKGYIQGRKGDLKESETMQTLQTKDVNNAGLGGSQRQNTRLIRYFSYKTSN